MKKVIGIALTILFIMIILAGCEGIIEDTTASPTLEVTNTPTAKPAITESPTPIPTETPTPKPTEKPTAKPTDAPTPNEDTVYVTASGKKYHSNSTCSNMKSPSKISKSTAISRGYGPCSKCY
jgi:DNA-entry nuclease